MLFRQFVDEDLGCGSYLVGDATPARRSSSIRRSRSSSTSTRRAAEGVRIVRVLETHTHADHLSGHGRFALEHGVPVSIHPLARAGVPVRPARGRPDAIRVGSVEIRVVHTPGHRPEHCAFVVGGELVLTGDSLFVGDAARPDLAIEAREGAADLFRSLRRLAELPDAIVVYPGHVSGSLCGTNMSDEHSTSIGREKADEPRAARATSATFVEESASLSTPRPPTTERCVALNRGPWVAARPPLEPARRRRATRSCSTCARSRTSPPATSPARSASRSTAARSRPARRSCSTRRAVRRARALARPRRTRRRGCSGRSGCSRRAATSLDGRGDRDDARP